MAKKSTPDSAPPAPQTSPPSRSQSRMDLAAPAFILLAFILLAGYYVSRPGLAWDEALLVPNAEVTRLWFTGLPETFTWKRFYDSVGQLTSHPPLPTYLMALTTQLFADSMSRLYAARVASVAQMGALLAAVYFFTLYYRGRLAAVAAAGTLLLLPRFFAEGLLATFDMPMAFWWFASAASFYVAMERPRWAPVAGLAAGLAVLTKVNGLLLPLVLWPWGLAFHGRRALRAILWSAVLMPAVFFALWPFLWQSPHIAVGKYLGEKFPFIVDLYARFGVDLHRHGDPIHRMMRRSDVPVFYFGKVYFDAPWHYPWVMTAVTTPLAALAAAAAGALRWTRERYDSRFYAFVIWNVLFWLTAFSAGLSKPYDGVRLFLLVFPFLAILSGTGMDWLWSALLPRKGGKTLAAATAVAYAALLAAPFLRYAPYTSYYNELVGGLPGAAAKGFQVTYWGEQADDAVYNYLNAAAPRGARIAAFPMERLYVENARFFGLLRADVVDVTTADDWDYMIIANRADMLAARPDIEALARGAAVTRMLHGVPAAWVVERKR